MLIVKGGTVMPTAIYKALFVCREHRHYEAGGEMCVMTERSDLTGHQEFVPVQVQLIFSHPDLLDITPGQEVEIRLKTKPL